VHFTVGNATRLIDNYATFHNDPGDPDQGSTNMVFVDGHVGFVPRLVTDEELEEGFRLAWPKKEVSK
jgi:prepilin-type processing-associated H-X9-DG protein